MSARAKLELAYEGWEVKHSSPSLGRTLRECLGVSHHASLAQPRLASLPLSTVPGLAARLRCAPLELLAERHRMHACLHSQPRMHTATAAGAQRPDLHGPRHRPVPLRARSAAPGRLRRHRLRAEHPPPLHHQRRGAEGRPSVRERRRRQEPCWQVECAVAAEPAAPEEEAAPEPSPPPSPSPPPPSPSPPPPSPSPPPPSPSPTPPSPPPPPAAGDDEPGDEPAQEREPEGRAAQEADGRVPLAELPHIIHLVSDDVGWNDLGRNNGGQTDTPRLNQAR